MRGKRTPWTNQPRQGARSRPGRSIQCLREEDGWHPRCSCGWFRVEGVATMDEAVDAFDLHRRLTHTQEASHA